MNTKTALVLGVALATRVTPPLAAQSADGLWMSEGYGNLIETRGGEMHAFQVTSVSCVPTWTADRVSAGDSGATVFKMRDAAAKFAVRPATSADSWWFQGYGAASSELFHRLASRPATCARPTATDPETLFEVLWTTFA